MRRIVHRLLRGKSAPRKTLTLGQRMTTQAGTAEVVAIYPPSTFNPSSRLVAFKPDDGRPVFSRFVAEDGTIQQPQLPIRSE